MKTYSAVYFGSMLVAIILTMILLRVARSLRLVDSPGVRKIHRRPVPRIGGIAIVVSTLALTSAVLVLHNAIGLAFRMIATSLIVMLAAGVLVFVVGLIDDVRGLRVRVRLLAQVLAAFAVCAAGVRINGVHLAGWFDLDFGWLSWPITVFWIVGITNAVNLIDGLDGLAAGIAAIACGVIALFAVCTGQVVMAVLMLALLGSLSGFLFLNFNPARIFLGDCGSTFLGFIIAASSTLCTVKSATLVSLALTALALGVPIFDTLFSMLRRTLQRRSMTAPDRGHIHHRLLELGLSHRTTVAVMYVVTLLAAGMGLFMLVTRGVGTALVFVSVLVLLLTFFRAAGSVRLREAIASIKRNWIIALGTRQQREVFEKADLLLCDARSFEDWWQAICKVAEEMKFLRISLRLENRDGTARCLQWACPADRALPGSKVSLSVPVRHRRRGQPLLIEVDVPVIVSLESAGRRVSFLGRLIDEHSIADLPPPAAPGPPWAPAAPSVAPEVQPDGGA